MAGDTLDRAAMEESEARQGQTELVALCLERARYEYTELTETWKQLDSKAERTAAIAGIFLAALFAFLRDSLLGSGNLTGQVIATAMLSLLILTMWNAFRALRVVEASMPPDARWAWNEVKRVATDDGRSPLDVATARRDLSLVFIDGWLDANADLDRKNAIKARCIATAQRFLAAAALMAFLLAVARIWLPARLG